MIYCFIIATTLSSAGKPLPILPPPLLVKTIKVSPSPSLPANTPVTIRQAAVGSTNLLIECSTNLIDWIVLTNVDISQAQINPDTGQPEIYVEIQLDESFVMSMTGFFKNVLVSGDISTNLPVKLFSYLQPPISYNPAAMMAAGYPFNMFVNKSLNNVTPHSALFAALAIAVIIIIVGTVIIYTLYLFIKSLGW